MPATRPNILFFFPDQHRPDWLGCNPNLPLRTPNLDSLCSRGVRFSSAFTPSPLCSPARACLATGRDYRRCGVVNNGQNTPLDLPTYYGRLRSAGYEVAGVGKFDLHKPDHDWGLDGSKLLREYGFTAGIDNEGKGDAITSYRDNGMSARGPYMRFLSEQGLAPTHLAMYEPYMGTSGWLNFPAVTDLPDDAYCDNWVASNAGELLRGFATGKPWHLVVNFVGPHGPFDVTADMRHRWESVEIPPPVNGDPADIALTRQRRQNYAAMIENIDRHVGLLVDIVRQRGELDNTLIVYASDHGEMLGDHRRWAKSVFHTAASGIPMIVAGPGIVRGAVCNALTALHDLSATFLDYAGAEAIADSDALSLRGVLENTGRHHREHLFGGLGRWDMTLDERHKLVTGWNDGRPLLFDRLADPHDEHDVSDQRPEVVARLTEILKANAPGQSRGRHS